MELMEGEINTDYSAASEGFVSFVTAVVLMHLLHLGTFESVTLVEAAPTRSWAVTRVNSLPGIHDRDIFDTSVTYWSWGFFCLKNCKNFTGIKREE